MGKRGRPKKEKVQEEVKVEEPVSEEPVQEEEIENIKLEELEEVGSDFDLTKQNPYLVAGFKASKHYTTDKNYVEENFKKYVKTGE